MPFQKLGRTPTISNNNFTST